MTARGATFALLSALAAAAPALGQPDGRAGPPAFDDDGPRPGMDEPRRGPPPQIFMACVGLPEEAACVFPTPEGPVKGTCVPFPNGKLACLPPWKRRPPEPRRGEIAPLLRQEPSPAQFQRQAEQSPVAPLPAPWTEAKPPETKQSRSPAANPVLPLPPKAGEGRAEGESPPRPRPLVRALILLAAGAGLFALYKRLTTKAAPPVVAAPAPPASLPQPAAPAGPTGGKLIAKNYEIRREIGLGGMGVVYEAVDLSLDRRIALKKMRPEIGMNARARERFLTEARTVAKLQHPNVVAIHAILEDDGDLYLAFEYIDGETLDDMLARQTRLSGQQAMRILGDVASAVDYAHTQRVIHRDLKPSNIMVDHLGRAKVMDFGIAHEAKVTVSRLTSTEAYGTMAYMPPEQELGQAVRESDVYAFAAVTYETLTGGLPFPGPNFHLQKMEMAFQRPSTASMPAALDRVFERAFHPEPKQRYPTTGEFVKMLQAALI